jgi:hypothetical protein
MKFHKNRARRFFVLALALCVALSLSGCDLFEKEYRVEADYVDSASTLKDDPGIISVQNFIGMKNALIKLIEAGEEYGTIRTDKYRGSAEDDISRACFEVTRETPIGLYAVDYMTHSVSQILSYYEMEIYIRYKRSADEIAGVTTVYSAQESYDLIKNALESFDASVAIMQVSSSVSEEEIIDFVDECYLSSLQNIPEKPKLSVNTYAPDEDAIQRITEVVFTFSQPKSELRERSRQLRDYAYSFYDGSNFGSISHVCSSVMERAKPGLTGKTAYNALFGTNFASSEGYALAVKLLCLAGGIECYVVKGRLNGSEHFWNIVNIDGSYYHIDLFTADKKQIPVGYYSDDYMWGSYQWDNAAYPSCIGRQDSSLLQEKTEEEEAETGEEAEE